MEADLSPDARAAHADLVRRANLLAAGSTRLTLSAGEVGSAYYRALAGGDAESWARFVAAAASLLNGSEAGRTQHAFFEQIVNENADLLALELV